MWHLQQSRPLDPLEMRTFSVHGADSSTAWVEGVGFGGFRKVTWGRGAILQSPSTIVQGGKRLATEEQVIYAPQLPTYDDTLSMEEAEALASYLTVDYVRIPLVLGFFASHERASFLFHPELQVLLQAVLFEAGPFAAGGVTASCVPVRCDPDVGTAVLGARHGLLLNELHHVSMAVMRPVQVLLEHVFEVSGADMSVHSAEAGYALFIVSVASTLELYVKKAWDMAKHADPARPAHLELLEGCLDRLHEFLRERVSAVLQRWIDEAEAEWDQPEKKRQGNLPTLCVLHAFMAMAHSGALLEEANARQVGTFIGSMTYVRTWTEAPQHRAQL